MAKVDDLYIASSLTAKLMNYCMISGFRGSKHLYYLLSYYITYSGMQDHLEGVWGSQQSVMAEEQQTSKAATCRVNCHGV
jgi:hypothetical protein